MRVDERTVRLATDDTIVMCSSHVWRALGERLAAAVDDAGRATRAVAIVAHYRGYETA